MRNTGAVSVFGLTAAKSAGVSTRPDASASSALWAKKAQVAEGKRRAFIGGDAGGHQQPDDAVGLHQAERPLDDPLHAVGRTRDAA